MNWRVAAGLPSSPFAAMRTMAHSRTFVWGLSRSTSKRIYNATKCPHCQLINICFYLFFLLIFSHFGFTQQRIAFFPMQKSLFYQMWMVDGIRETIRNKSLIEIDPFARRRIFRNRNRWRENCFLGYLVPKCAAEEQQQQQQKYRNARNH